jgi:hypothetical protein
LAKYKEGKKRLAKRQRKDGKVLEKTQKRQGRELLRHINGGI